MSDILAVAATVADHLATIQELFKPGTKVTLLARCPDRLDGARDFVLTNDTLDAVLLALTIRLNEDVRQASNG